MAAMARPRGGGFSSELTLAAPILTSFTTIPGVAASAWLTRRMQVPQCIPSILSAYSANSFPSSVYLMIEAGERFALSGPPWRTQTIIGRDRIGLSPQYWHGHKYGQHH
jgi:hypothetical protein